MMLPHVGLHYKNHAHAINAEADPQNDSWVIYQKEFKGRGSKKGNSTGLGE